MKKSILIACITILGITQINAQSDIRFGAKAGLNISTLGGDSALSLDPKLGFHLGGLLEIPFTDDIIIQPEALISLQGSGGFLQDDFNFWYLNVPVMAKYNIWDELYIEAGPQISLLLSDNVEGNLVGGFADDEDFLNDTNAIDIGFGVGAGYRLDEDFYFQLRFNVGLINSIEDFSSKNRTVQISAVYFYKRVYSL